MLKILNSKEQCNALFLNLGSFDAVKDWVDKEDNTIVTEERNNQKKSESFNKHFQYVWTYWGSWQWLK